MGLKKVLSLLTVTMLVATSVVGCGSSGGNSKKDGDKVKVDIVQFKVEAKDSLEKAAKEYEKKNPNVDINIETVGGGNEYGPALKSKFQSGQEPAIFNIGGPQDVEDWVSKSKLEDLSDQPWVDKAFEGTLDSVTTKDGIFGMPFNQEGYGFIYNKEIFKKAGIDSASITSFDALQNAAKTLDSKKGELGLDAVFAVPGKEKWVTGLHLLNVASANEFKSSKEAYEAKKLEFKYDKELKELLDLQTTYAFMPDGKKSSINSVDYAMQIEQKYSTGKVAMVQMGNWAYGGIEGVNKDIASNSGILPMPIKGAKEDSIPVGVPMYWCINKDKSDAEKDAAKDFLNWLYTSDEGKKMIIDDFKFIPAFKGYESDELQPKDPLSKDVLKYSNEGKTMPWVFMGYPSGWGESRVGANMQKYLDGSMTWDDLVKNAKTTWEEERK
ncbi:ABC transporter substrate-binding protein [Paraclostridium ghonii]|uniref:Raffinose/stachyose/melibiose transport system substrate-binding protein n=1 Tax=Paraclostridium ghonii TaxID=29358 RepID=A0ABU0MXC8_9FIRM|nr:ABC transporter substrate-binding protein [Paeniclostridium ghonii]MDQ0555569.1 raffinose/stachyose/melibiose transport system substrate-binding protein [Paeniclostridium ghonii]